MHTLNGDSSSTLIPPKGVPILAFVQVSNCLTWKKGLLSKTWELEGCC